MHVPDHIYIDPTRNTAGHDILPLSGGHRRSVSCSASPRVPKSKSTITEEMYVPDRIVLNNQGKYQASRQLPTELMADRMTAALPLVFHQMEVPDKITIEHVRQNEIDQREQRRVMNNISEASMAIDDDPIRELKQLRRQVALLSTKVFQLEDTQNKGWTFQVALSCLGIALAVALSTAVNIRRRF